MLKEAEEKKAKQREITLDGINEQWKNYLEKLTSKSSQTALNTCLIEFEGRTIKVFTPTAYAKEIISQEVNLMNEIRDYFHREDLILITEVDKEKFPDYEDTTVIKTRLTDTEIYNNMVAVNPHLKELVQRLGLKPEGS